MRIFIAGSFHFAKEMMEVQAELEKMGHQAIVPIHTKECAENPSLKNDLEKDLEAEIALGVKDDVMRKCFGDVASSDAFLVVNLPKNNVEGYLGVSVLMEMAVAFVSGKKVFLFSDIDRTQKYAPEVLLLEPTVINSDLTKIK